jgi:MoaA/NifB/PqqE/SkfB family radical SAM enzyme
MDQDTKRDSVRAPTGALLQVTRFCNLSCAHCSQSAPHITRSAESPELSTRTWFDILGNLHEIGIPRVRFTGGEPFMRRDIEDLCREAVRLNLMPSFVTNGLAILPRHIQWLCDVQPASLWVSLYGYPAEGYSRVVSQDGLFPKALRTIEALVAASVDVGLYIPLGASNVDVAMESLLRDAYEMGVRKIKSLQLLPIGRLLNRGTLSPLPTSRLERALQEIAEEIHQYPGMTVQVAMRSGQQDVFRSSGFKIPDDRDCYAGLERTWTIDCEGMVIPCCLGLGRPGQHLLDARDLKQLHTWRIWNRATSLAKIGVRDQPLTRCPMLDRGIEGFTGDFVCPLTYAEVAA